MTDVDGLIQMCCASPTDTTRRGVLADKLAELGESELEAAMRSDDGEKIVRELWQLADQIKREPCLRLLWSLVLVLIPSLNAMNHSLTMPSPLTDEQRREIEESFERMHRGIGSNRQIVLPGHYEVTPNWTYREATTYRNGTSYVE